MDIDILISNIGRTRNKIAELNKKVFDKQKEINDNNKKISENDKKIRTTKSDTTIKSCLSKNTSLSKKNSTLNKEISNLQRDIISNQKKLTSYEKQLNNAQHENQFSYSAQVIPEIKEEKNMTQDEYNAIITQFCRKIQKEGLTTKYGIITDIYADGNSGGNGRVLFGTLNKKNIAIKVLYQKDEGKRNRFKEEFINVLMNLQKIPGIVEQYLYDEIEFEGTIISYIIMKQYKGQLKNNDITEEKAINLFLDLCRIFKEVHKSGIIHRDLKPENILIDESSNIIVSDFGIAYYNPENYDFTGNTKYGELLGNRNFSPPEQSIKGTIPQKTMDIYAIGQVIQWYVTGMFTRGTNREHLYKNYDSSNMRNLDIIIEKCLADKPESRYQSIEEIERDIGNYQIKIVEKEKISISLEDNYDEFERNDLGLGDPIVVI